MTSVEKAYKPSSKRVKRKERRERKKRIRRILRGVSGSIGNGIDLVMEKVLRV